MMDSAFFSDPCAVCNQDMRSDMSPAADVNIIFDNRKWPDNNIII
jgi:hypothetical protein